MNKGSFLLAAVLAAFSAGAQAGGGDVAKGAVTAKAVCASCHGADGNSASADFPKLAGQHADYLAKALRDYQTGKRKNAIMAGLAKPLSKEDIANLAAYYASQKGLVTKY